MSQNNRRSCCCCRRVIWNLPHKKVNYIFLTLQSCMVEIIKVGGSNKYKIPHLKKYTLESIGLLPKQLSCEATLVEDVLNTLKKFDQLLFCLFCVLVSFVRFLSFIWDFTVLNWFFFFVRIFFFLNLFWIFRSIPSTHVCCLLIPSTITRTQFYQLLIIINHQWK